MLHRPRRLRRNASIRNLTQEHCLSTKDLVMPLFVLEGENIRQPIPSMPGIERLSPDQILKECKELWQLGIQAVAPFSGDCKRVKRSTRTGSPGQKGLISPHHNNAKRGSAGNDSDHGCGSGPLQFPWS